MASAVTKQTQNFGDFQVQYHNSRSCFLLHLSGELLVSLAAVDADSARDDAGREGQAPGPGPAKRMRLGLASKAQPQAPASTQAEATQKPALITMQAHVPPQTLSNAGDAADELVSMAASMPIHTISAADQISWLHSQRDFSCSLCLECESSVSQPMDLDSTPPGGAGPREMGETLWQRLPLVQQLACLHGSSHAVVSPSFYTAVVGSPSRAEGMPLGCLLVGTSTGLVWAHRLDASTAAPAGTCSGVGGMRAKLSEQHSLKDTGKVLLFDLGQPLVAILPMKLGWGEGAGQEGATRQAASSDGHVPAVAGDPGHRVSSSEPYDTIVLLGARGRIVAMTAPAAPAEPPPKHIQQVLQTFHQLAGTGRAASTAQMLCTHEWQLLQGIDTACVCQQQLVLLYQGKASVVPLLAYKSGVQATGEACHTSPSSHAHRVPNAATAAGAAGRLVPSFLPILDPQAVRLPLPIQSMCCSLTGCLHYITKYGSIGTVDLKQQRPAHLHQAHDQHQHLQQHNALHLGMPLMTRDAVQQRLRLLMAANSAISKQSAALQGALSCHSQALATANHDLRMLQAVHHTSPLRHSPTPPVLLSPAPTPAAGQTTARGGTVPPTTHVSTLHGTTSQHGVYCQLQPEHILPNSTTSERSSSPSCCLMVAVEVRNSNRHTLTQGWHLILRSQPDAVGLPSYSCSIPLPAVAAGSSWSGRLLLQLACHPTSCMYHQHGSHHQHSHQQQPEQGRSTGFLGAYHHTRHQPLPANGVLQALLCKPSTKSAGPGR